MRRATPFLLTLLITCCGSPSGAPESQNETEAATSDAAQQAATEELPGDAADGLGDPADAPSSGSDATGDTSLWSEPEPTPQPTPEPDTLADVPDAGAPSEPADYDDSPWTIRILSRPLFQHANGEDTSGGSSTISAVFAKFHPLLTGLEVVAEEGSCRFSKRSIPFCDPPCGAGLICSPPGQCEEWPEKAFAGEIHVTSSAGFSSDLSFHESADYYYFGDQELTFPGGAEFTVSATGDEVPAFDVSGTMPAPLELTTLFPAWGPVDATQDMVYTWKQAEPGARIRLYYAAEYYHGLMNSAELECDVEDTGQLVVPAALLQLFCDGSLWGCGECPPLELRRYRKSTVAVGDGVVDLWLESLVARHMWTDCSGI